LTALDIPPGHREAIRADAAGFVECGESSVFRPAITVATLIVALGAPTVARAPGGGLHFRVLANTGIRLTDVAWTGKRLLYVENTVNTIWSAPPAGKPLTKFASLPKEVEETRCRISPGTHGWPAGAIFCHTPTNTIYRIPAGGGEATVFARIDDTDVADGALAFDTVGRFGYGLVAATGRSGAGQPPGGTVYRIDPGGSVKKIGTYDGPGGADEVEIAPARFGSAAGAALLAVDAGKTGRLAAMDANGKVATVAPLGDGPNPIAAISPSVARGGKRAGLYLTDTLSHNALFAPASDVRAYAGGVIVGSELKGLFWVVRPRGSGFEVKRLVTTLRAKGYNLEGMTYVSP